MWNGFGRPKLPGEKTDGEAPRVVVSPATGEVVRAETEEELAAKLRESADTWREAA